MNFTTRIFLSIMFVATLISIIVAGSLYSIFKKDIEIEFANRYLSYGNTIGNIFHYLEIASDLANKNAVLLLSNIEASKGIPSDKELDLLAKKFGVNSFYVINKSGKFIRSSDLPIKQQINSFFSYNKEYRSLVSGNTEIAFTPIIPGYPYDIPAKFAMIPNHDKTLILESSTHLEYIDKILHQIIMSDKNIRSVGLYAPTGYELGSISSSGKFNQGRRNAINDFSLSNKTTNEAFIFSIKIPSLTENCPECVQKGVSLDKKYYYVLRLEVSIFPLLARLNLLKTEIIFVFIVILIIGVVLSRIISKKLVNRIEKINLTASNIIESQNMDLRVLINGNDEIARLATTFNKMIEVLKESQTSIVETEKMRSMAKISAQLAHDIRSPLAAMEILLKSIAKDQPEKFYIMLREAIQGVRDIANNYLINYRHVPESKNSHVYSPVNSPDDGNVPRPLLLSSLVESVISQKRLEYLDCEIGFIKKSFDKLSWIQAIPNEIRRILSNLLNNAYEALQSDKRIEITIALTQPWLELYIADNGHGIPENRINDVLSGLSLKHDGKGLGLSSARQYMEALGGSLTLSSTPGKGSEILLRFPAASKPDWLPDEIRLPKNSHVIIMDDNLDMHNLWRHRLDSHHVKTQHFSSVADILQWRETSISVTGQAIYFVDYEFHDEKYNGLTLIELFNCNNRSYLITSYADEIGIQEHCKKAGIWLLPKYLIGEINIVSID